MGVRASGSPCGARARVGARRVSEDSTVGKRLERKSTTTENSCRETDTTLTKDAHEGGTTPPGAMGGVAEEALPVIVPLLFLGAVAFTLGAVTLACFAINGSGDGVSGAWRADDWAGCRGRRTRAGGDGPRPARGARGGARFHGWFSKQTPSRGELDRALPSARAPARAHASLSPRRRGPTISRPGAGTRRTRRVRDGVDDGFEGRREGRSRSRRAIREAGRARRRVRAGGEGETSGRSALGNVAGAARGPPRPEGPATTRRPRRGGRRRLGAKNEARGR